MSTATDFSGKKEKKVYALRASLAQPVQQLWTRQPENNGPIPNRRRNISLHYCAQIGCGARPMCTSRVKRLKQEADHSPPSSAEVKNAWSYISSLLYIFVERYLISHRDKSLMLPFTFFY
jgi:hypothetical protein